MIPQIAGLARDFGRSFRGLGFVYGEVSEAIVIVGSELEESMVVPRALAWWKLSTAVLFHEPPPLSKTLIYTTVPAKGPRPLHLSAPNVSLFTTVRFSQSLELSEYLFT